MSKDRRDLVEPFDSELGSARIDRGEWDRPPEPTDAREGGHPEDAERQLRPEPPDELVGTAGPGPGEPGDEHGSAGMDSGSMDSGSMDTPPDPSGVVMRGWSVPASVREAFDAVPREHFLPEDQRRFADRDAPLEIGAGATNSQPSTVAAMLDLLDVRPDQRVLDVGAGSGWTTALLAHLVGPGGLVVGVEIDPQLAEWGAVNLAAHGAGPWARLEAAQPDVLGWPQDAPYDRVLVSAMADELPDELVEQLAPGGVLVVPVSGEMVKVRLSPDGERTVTRHGAYRFVPLR